MATKAKTQNGVHGVPLDEKSDAPDLTRALFRSLDRENSGKISKYALIERLCEMGLLPEDPRVSPLIQLLTKSPADYLEIDFDQFIELTKTCAVLIQRALQGQFVLPDFSGFSKRLRTIYEAIKDDNGGHVASYIPHLARVSADKFGVSVCTIDGQRFSIGDAKDCFSIQSISKTVSYCLALEGFGEEVVHHHVGREPSGSSFNAITLDAKNRPHNPMINAGAIMSCSMIKPDAKPAERFDYVISTWERLAAPVKPIFNNAVFLSERQSADRNFALAYFMSEKRIFPKNTDLATTLDLYFQCCSIELTCEGMAMVAATLAKGGINPITGERIFNAATIKNCLSLMNSCGMYDFSGEFAFTIGLPAKSGVGGGVMVVVPDVMGFCVWSPPIDEQGNSVRGVRFCHELVRNFNFHNYDSLVAGEGNKTDPRRKQIDRKLDGVVALCWAASCGDIRELQQLIANGVDVTEADYDGRTPLHIAASENHLNAVEFLVRHGASITAKDRWGNTPLDDAVRESHTAICDFFHKHQEAAKQQCDGNFSAAKYAI